MIGKCVTCKTEIVVLGTKRFCEVCAKERRTRTWKIYNQRREGRRKNKLVCGVCNDEFYSPGTKKYSICYKSSCVSYFNNLKIKIKHIPERLEKYQQELAQSKDKYDRIVGQQG